MPGTYLPEVWSKLTNARLQGYRANAAEQDWELLARYMWNLELGAALYPSLSLLEVGLRNVLDSAIAAREGAMWFQDPNVVVQAKAQAEVGQAIAKLQAPGGAVPTHDQVVAALDFGFWTNLFNREYEVGPPAGAPAGQRFLWPSLLPGTFPHQTRRVLAGRFHDIRKLRNRIFHYEPIWRGMPHPAGGVRTLDQQHADLMQAVSWISSQLQRTALLLDEFPRIYAGGPRSYRTLLQLLDP